MITFPPLYLLFLFPSHSFLFPPHYPLHTYHHQTLLHYSLISLFLPLALQAQHTPIVSVLGYRLPATYLYGVLYTNKNLVPAVRCSHASKMLPRPFLKKNPQKMFPGGGAGGKCSNRHERYSICIMYIYIYIYIYTYFEIYIHVNLSLSLSPASYI